jgi:hypothetical protein
VTLRANSLQPNGDLGLNLTDRVLPLVYGWWQSTRNTSRLGTSKIILEMELPLSACAFYSCNRNYLLKGFVARARGFAYDAMANSYFGTMTCLRWLVLVPMVFWCLIILMDTVLMILSNSEIWLLWSNFSRFW